MFEGGKGVYAEGFGTLDEHRVLPKRYPISLQVLRGCPAYSSKRNTRDPTMTKGTIICRKCKAQHSHGGSGSRQLVIFFCQFVLPTTGFQWDGFL